MNYQAITVHQPWASLIAFGYKRYEFRQWRPPVAIILTRIAIHAGKKPMQIAEARYVAEHPGEFKLDAMATELLEGFIEAPDTVPYSALLTTAFLGRPQRCGDLWPDDPEVDADMWAWPLTNVEPINPPIPASGKQGFWTWEDPRDDA